MPEINPLNKNFIKEISRQKNEVNSREKIKNAIEDLDVPVIGSGSTCIAIEHPSDKEKVVTVNYKNMDELRAKDIYYSSKVYNTLFPNNFPQIYFSSAEQNDEKLNGTVREKIQGDVIIDTSKEKNSHPFGDVRREILILAGEPYNLPVGLDGTVGNMIENHNGTYYIDTLSVGSIMSSRDQDKTKKINIEGIKDYMINKKYSESDIQIVISSLKRLQALYKNEDLH